MSEMESDALTDADRAAIHEAVTGRIPEPYGTRTEYVCAVVAARTSAAVAQEQERIAAVRALAESVDVFYPSKFKFGAEANYVAGYNAARNDLRAALARGGDDRG